MAEEPIREQRARAGKRSLPFPLCELERQPCEHELVRRLVCVAFG